MANAKRDENRTAEVLVEDANGNLVPLLVDAVTGRLKVNATITGEVVTSSDKGKEIRTFGNYVYIGSSTTTDTSQALWKVKRLDKTNTFSTKWADGDQDYDNIFDNYLTLSYL